MKGRLLVGLLLCASMASANEFAKARVLEKVNALNLRPDQVGTLLEASRMVQQARVDHVAELRTQVQSEEWLAEIVDQLAAGQQISEADRQAYEAAAGKRRELDSRLAQKIDSAVQTVVNRLSNDQRMRLGVPNEVRQSANRYLEQVRTVQGRDWERLQRDLVRRLSRREYSKMRENYDSRESGLGRRERSQEMRQQMEQIQNWAQTYVNRVRQGDQQAIREFEATYATNTMREGEADRTIAEAIRDVVTADFAIEALEEKIAALNGGP